MKRPVSQKPTYRVPFRRRRNGLTDYRYRDRLLRSGLPRAVVRKSLRNTTVQLVEFDPKGDRIVASASSLELREFGWQGSLSNTPAAYLTGLLAGKRAKLAKIDNAVLDIGLQTPTRGSKVFSALKGMLDAGIAIPHDPGVLPKDERLKGKSADFENVKKNVKEPSAGRKEGIS